MFSWRIERENGFEMDWVKIVKNRSSHRRCSIYKDISKNFAIFTGKHLCWSLFLIKLQAFRPTLKNICEQLLLKKEVLEVTGKMLKQKTKKLKSLLNTHDFEGLTRSRNSHLALKLWKVQVTHIKSGNKQNDNNQKS